MNKYTIYCTEEQTRKAFELGAPIKPKIDLFIPYLKKTPHTNISIDGEDAILILPTAEQMISWLEEQHKFRYIGIDCYPDYNWCYSIYPWTGSSICQDEYLSRKEATLAAIDSALKYLTDKNK